MRSLWLAGLWAGCSGADDGPPRPPVGTDSPTLETTGETGQPVPGPDLVVRSEHAYQLTQTWSLGSLEVRAGWDLTVSWSGITTDAWGEPLPPAAVERLVLLEILAPPAELPARLAADDLGSDLISVWETEVSGTAFARLSDLSYLSTPFQPSTFLAEDPAKSWLVALARREGERLDLLAGVVLVPRAAGAATQAALVDGQLGVVFSASPGPSALRTAATWETWSIDWSGLGQDALGKPYDRFAGDELFLARYDGAVADRLAAPLELQATAAAWWTMDVAREETALPELARDAEGATFPGFTAGDSWLIGVRCTTCLTRFPLWVAAVEVD